jgi:hypothetical protein
MSRTHTRYIDFWLLQARAPSSATVVKLMMACNDMSLANQTLARWKPEYQTSGSMRAWGACLYAIRAQFGHLYEGLNIIKAIRADSQLLQIVDQCDQRTQESFQKSQAYLVPGAKRSELERFAGIVRSTVTFHYDETGKLVERAIAALAKRGRSSSVTRASTAPDWHFELADLVVDEVVCRQIWRIPEVANQSAEADKIVGELYDVFLTFMDFAGEFIWRYCSA